MRDVGGSDSNRTEGSTSQMVECVTAFASAVKNLTIYPATHPRVVERADEFAAQFGGLDQDACELTFQGQQLLINGEPCNNDHLAVRWLIERGRDAGLRGVRIERRCRADDVVTFANALIACRQGQGTSLADNYDHPEAHVQPLALVVEEIRGNRARRGSQAAPAAPATAGDANSTIEKLEFIAGTPNVRNLLRTIESIGGGDDLDAQEVNLIEMISDLLPVDGPTELEELTATVEQILTRVQGEMHEVIRQDTKVRGAELLRSAVGLARTFFGRSAETTERKQLPAGRPEDARIVADLEALLEEFRALPDASGVVLPPAEELAEGAPTTTHELIGVCLHSLAHTRDAEHLRERLELIAALMQRDADVHADLLDTYFTPMDGEDAAPIATRLAMLSALADRGMGQLISDRGYLDADLLQAGFPEVLLIAAETCTSDDEFARLRSALEMLKPVLENGGYQAAADTNLLDKPSVVRLLTQTRGGPALQLLSMCESDAPAVLALLRDFVNDIKLPPAETAALAICRNNQLPVYYLRRVLRAAAARKFDESVRRASGELLRDHFQQHRAEMPEPALERAIGALEHVPDPETVALLEELSKSGRLNFGARARATRRAATETLQRIQQRSRS